MSEKTEIPKINRNNIAKVFRLRNVAEIQNLQEQSIRDSLTGLYNRRYFDDEMKKVDEKDQSGTLVILDVDKFKDVNDLYGHPLGDKVLISLARVIQDKVQIVGNGEGPDIVARLGGEEFGIYFKNFSEEELVKKRVEQIRKAVEESFVKNDGKQIKTTISLGVAVRQSKEPYGELMKRADRALYDAKESGRNKYVVSIKNA